VSRWSLERLRIGLAPQRVDVARLAWGPRRRVLGELHAQCVAKPGDAPWQAAIGALDALLAPLNLHGASATVVLSNHWVRYLVLPWQPELTSPAEVEQLARLRFTQTFGPAAQGWTVRTHDGGYGAAQLACAVDSALVDALRACLAARGLRLASLQPLLMAAVNEVRRELDGGHTALAILEPGRLCLGLMQQGRWLDVATRRADADAAEVIEQELATRAAQDVPPRLDVLMVGAAADALRRAARPLRMLGASPTRGARTLAMVGAA
jgi:hypothetical protein